MDVPNDLRYAASHEWARTEADGSVTVGITDFAQDQLGDVVFVELPAVGAHVSAGDPVAVVESVKTASDIYAPVAGTVSAVNDALETSPEAINGAPYGGGWIFRLQPDASGDVDGLLDPDGYRAAVDASA